MSISNLFAPFSLYHGLGNDYLVLESGSLRDTLTPTSVSRICERHFGIGADGILLREPDLPDGSFVVRIINPDGSYAEKSGNGLRIFSRYLFDQGMVVAGQPFRIRTDGGTVDSTVLDAGRRVRVAMGHASFSSDVIPVTGASREVLEEPLRAAGRDLTFSAVTVGNPHCVFIGRNWSRDDVCEIGPLVECDPRFPNRTNVQFVEVMNRQEIRLEIWERGAGYTLASGSSSCAAAAVCRKLNLCDSQVTAMMPGGELSLVLDDAFGIEMEGPVVAIAAGELSAELLRDT
ncbi:MAG: diaminopimelate epimerase [Gammaproteobacteria bacterium]|nr:diaminopimelate epimerase [Gammaproteobacteria bacterium]